MNKPVLYIIFLFCFSKFLAQENLVPNGSFEDTLFCPIGTGNILAVNYWYNPTQATPDYYNACDQTYGSSVPMNDWGYQYAQDGNGYIGLVTYGQGLFTSNYREYVQVKLKQPLIKDEYYCWSGYLSLLDSCGFASNNFGVAFSENEITDFSSESILPISSSWHYDQIILDNDGWTLVEFLYLANGTEKFMTLGNFNQNDDTEKVLLDSFAIGGSAAYYFVDNVLLNICDFELNFPNVFTPNNDGVNDIFKTSDLPTNTNIVILNRWGQQVFVSSKPNAEYWNGTTNGENNPNGTYFYVLEGINFKKTGFIQLIR